MNVVFVFGIWMFKELKICVLQKRNSCGFTCYFINKQIAVLKSWY